MTPMQSLIERLERFNHGRREPCIDEAIAALKSAPESKEDIYGYELDKVAEVLTKLHPIGKVKAIGRLESAQALLEVFKSAPDRHSRPTCAGLWLAMAKHGHDHFPQAVLFSEHDLLQETWGSSLHYYGPIPEDSHERE